MNKNIKIGTRGSKLSLAYAEKVRKLLLKTKKVKLAGSLLKKLKLKETFLTKGQYQKLVVKMFFVKN